MASVHINDLPPETYAVQHRRAAAAHQPLQEYLRSRLIEEASIPTTEEILQRAGVRAGGAVSFAAALQALRDGRDRH